MATIEQALNTMAANEDSLLDNPNVSYISVVQTDELADNSDDFSLVVGLIAHELEVVPDVEDADTDDALQGFEPDIVPTELQIVDGSGAAIENVGMIEVRTEVTGEITAQSFTDRRRPARGGNSCGNPRVNSAGTLGAAVNYRGAVHILSNWHVTYGRAGRDGDAIVQAGRLDGGRVPRDVIAHNVKGWLDAYRDAAISKVRTPWNQFVAAGSRCYGRFGAPKVATVGMRVQKCGRTTRATTGVVRSINATVRVNGYPTGTRVFRDQILTSGMSSPGDSGSLICEARTNSPVGLLFAGSSSVTVANKLQRLFGQTLESGESASDFLDGLDFNVEE